MKAVTTYGLKCSRADEKDIVLRVNEYLDTHDRTLSKAKNPSLLNARLPHVLRYYYWNLNRPMATYFEIFLNEGVDGKFYDETNRDCAWIVHVIIDRHNRLYVKDEAEKFLFSVLKAISFPYVIIKETEPHPN